MLTQHNLEARQNLPLEQKIVLSQFRIRDWYNHFKGDVYVSFSGGKDSTVLLDLVRNTPGVYDVPAVFCDTGLEYPEIREFARLNADVVLRPKLTFKEVIEKYGFPVISKEQAQYIRQYTTTKSDKLKNLRFNGGEKGNFCISKKWRYLIDAPFKVSEQCCDIMKKRPFKAYEKLSGRKPMTGVMACESNLRKQQYQKNGCNSFDANNPKSSPMGFWTEQDVLNYIKINELEYASVYGEIIPDPNVENALTTSGCKRTGCMFCMFGVHLEREPNRFQLMKETHPKQYAYCMKNLGLAEVLDYIGVPY